MPPKQRTRRSTADSEEDPRGDEAAVKRSRDARRSDFASTTLYHRFEAHVSAAQDAFLKGDTAAAEQEATLALRIRPTAHLFALLAVVAESKGRFDRATDFRLLQAFLSRDVVLWEELLHEFMGQQLYFKAVVCLQRMSALENEKMRYRALQLQLADLLIGLGEVRRASAVLVPLWNSSRCRDFEVFALLSSLYFQLGKWAALQRLIESSVRYAFKAAPAATTEDNAEASTQALSPSSAPLAESGGAARVSKRVRFFGMDGDSTETERSGMDGQGYALPGATGLEASSCSVPLPSSSGGADEFGFEEVEPGSALASPSPPLSAGGATLSTGGVVHQLYGEKIELQTEASKRNFLTLLNVHSELLNEQGSFRDTVQLLHMAAGCLEVDLMELPPDLLVRLAVAYAFIGGIWEQPCREVLQHLIEHCSMEDYGDVLLDAAVSLQKVGMHTEAAQLYTSLSRYHQFALDRLLREAEVQETALIVMEGTESMERVQAARDALDSLRAEVRDVQTVLAASVFGEAQSSYALAAHEESRRLVERVLELDPAHLQARLLLGRYYFYHRRDTTAAVTVLTPREGEPALQRIQLGAFLVRVFQHAGRYVEAIALGVSIFEMLLSSEEDGDTQSVAPGTSSRRSSGSTLYLPSMTRASSAIIPAASLAGMVGVGAGSTAAMTARTSFTLAASIRASSSVARQRLGRRGLESLTTTSYGASAAASVAAGWDKAEDAARAKDTATIFQFHRRRRPKTAASATKDVPGTAGEAQEEGDAETQQRSAAGRREAVLAMPASEFWEPTAAELKKEEKAEEETELKRVKAEPQEDEVEKGDGMSVPDTSHDANAVVVASPAPSPSPINKKGRKRSVKGGRAAGKEEGEAEGGEEDQRARARSANFTTLNEKERDLEELEAFLTQAEAIAVQQEEGKKSRPPVAGTPAKDADEILSGSYELPSLETVSEQFHDSAMAQLFLEASGFTPGGGVRGIEGHESESNPWATLAGGDGDAAATPLPGTGMDDKVTLREAMEALGSVGLISLAVAVVDCYSSVGKFIEAREFAFVALTNFGQKQRLQRLGPRLERPLRLAVLRAALAAGEDDDAYRVGLRLLQNDVQPEQRREVVELLHSVLNVSHSNCSVLYRSISEGYNDPALLLLMANRYFITRSFTRALHFYLVVLQEQPRDVLVNFMVGLCYLYCSHQKRVRTREPYVTAAIYYLTQYQQLRLSLESPCAIGEVLYNVARAMQFLRLYYLCVPLYERVAYDLCVPTECSVAVQRAARVNLYFLYRWGSGNRVLALSALQPRDTDGQPDLPARTSSPFAR